MSKAAPHRPASLVDRFPALRRLAFAKGRCDIPVIMQPSSTECGAVSLAMVLAYHGRYVKLPEMRRLVGVDRGGSDALSILKAAEAHGLRGRSLRIDRIDDLRYLERGAILHWEFNHWVVFDGLRRGGVQIVDPAMGRRFVARKQLERSFTGVALSFEEKPDFATTKKEKKRTWIYVRRVLTKASLFWRIIVTSLLIQVFGLVLPLITGMLVDTVIPRGDGEFLMVIGLGAGLLVVFHFLSLYLRSQLLLAFQTQADTSMTLDFLEHLVGLPYAFFQQRSPGDLMMRLNSNERIREILMGGALTGLLDGVMVLLYLALMLITSLKLGGIVLVLGAIQVIMFTMTRSRIRDLASHSLSAIAESQNYQVQLLSGIETLKASGAEHRAVTRWSNLYVDLLNINLSRGRLDAVIQSLNSALRLAAPVIVLVVGGIMVMKGELSLGMMLALNAMAAGFLGPLSSVLGTAFQFQTLGSYIDRIDDIFQTPQEQDVTNRFETERLKGEISLERVSFRYGATEPLVVRDVSIIIKPGQFVALVGASGSGKTTLAKLLLGLYLPVSGRVLFDGADLGTLDLRSVRRQFGCVPQNPYVFGLSVRENISMSDPGLTLAEIVAAAKLAHIHDEIMEMPMGYETLVADDGASLSGGQRQRLVLARALVRRPAVLLLDEATSSLDAVAERKIQNELARLRCTRIVIAHRLSTIVDADLILVMDGGKIAEEGTHEDLLARCGKYAQLVAAQLRSDQKWHDQTRVS
jgi:ATP-binding cassette, subfamily B, bacterial